MRAAGAFHAWLLAASAAAGPPAPLPPGFQLELVVADLDQPIALEFAPDGRLFVAEHGGAIRVIQNDALLPVPLGTVPTDSSSGERGVAGLAVDPDFAGNGWIYLYYTTLEPRNRLSRFTVSGASFDLASEVVLWESPTAASQVHHGGAVAFGNDGRLYVSTGDQGGGQNSSNLLLPHGKILRLEKDGSIPPDNPFAGSTSGVDPLIWAYGLRNPFRIAVDPADGTVWIGDVGSNSDSSFEEVNRGASGAFFGWPDQEGPLCLNGTCAGVTFPVWDYPRGDLALDPEDPEAAIVLGPVYRATAFPAEYQGNLFVGDYANRWIRRLVFDAAGVVVDDPVFLQPPYAGTVVDMEVGPAGELYFATFGGPSPGPPDVGAVYRIRFTGSQNSPPVVQASASPTSGAPPLAVQFSSQGTFDPDGSPMPLSYQWDFGDGQTSAEADPQHTYALAGHFEARLSVSDGQDTTLSGPIPIEVGDVPSAVILEPPQGFVYRAGDVIAFSGAGFEADGAPLPPAQFSWEVVRIQEGTATTVLGPLPGVASGSFTVPTTGLPPQGSHYEIRLTVTGASGLADTDVVVLQPDTAPVVLDTVPSGIALEIDGQPETTPFQIDSLVGFQHSVAAGDLVAGPTGIFAFACWSDGAQQEHAFTVPKDAWNQTAMYGIVGTLTAAAAVDDKKRNAEYRAATGQQFGAPTDSKAVSCGTDAGDAVEMGHQFRLEIPQGASIASARIRFTAASSFAAGGSFIVRSWAVDSAPEFDEDSPVPLTQFAPLNPEAVVWSPPAVSPGEVFETSDLGPLIEAVVDRDGWQPGNYACLVFEPASQVTGVLRVRNEKSGSPPTIEVEYVAGAPAPPCQPCGFTTVGSGVAPSHTIGLAGKGQPDPGATVEIAIDDAPASVSVLFAALSEGFFAAHGGVFLIDPAGIVLTLALPTPGGQATLPVFLPDDPAVSAIDAWFQVVSAGAQGSVAFSNGLRLSGCP